MFGFRKSLVRIATFAALALLCAASARAQEKVELRLNLQKGQTFDQVVAMQQKVSQTFRGKRVDSNARTRFGTHSEVLESSDDTLKIKTTYTFIVVEAKIRSSPDGVLNVLYDSRKKTNKEPISTQVLDMILGESLVNTVSRTGEIIEADSSKNSIQNQANQINGLKVFAKTPVAIGDSWQTKTLQSNTDFAFMFADYTLYALHMLAARENGVATLNVRATAESTPTSHALKMADTISQIDFSGTQHGVIRVDENTGLPNSFELHQRFFSRFFVATAKKPQSESSFPIYIKSTIRGWTTVPPR